jgi:ParB-like chromosome segregation protein Spo0J
VKTKTPEIVQEAFGKLKDDPANPRKITKDRLAKLKASLKEFGFVEPVVARKEDGLVLGGHQRRLAFKELCLESGMSDAEILKAKIPVVYVAGLSDAKAKMLNLSLNKNVGEWEYEKLTGILQSLSDEMTEFDMEASGFGSVEISDILGLTAPDKNALADLAPDKEAEVPVFDSVRKFSFKVEDEVDADVCQEALTVYGMTGPGSSHGAFVEAMKAALQVVHDGKK